VWVRSIVALIVLVFGIPGLAYGIAARTIRSDRDVARMMSEYFGVLSSYVVLAFFAAHDGGRVRALEPGRLLAVEGGETLAAWNLPHACAADGLHLPSVGLDSVRGLDVGQVGGAGADLRAAVHAALGISPELTQAAYRVGDSLGNPISPLNMYLVIVLAFLRRHDEKSGLGHADLDAGALRPGLRPDVDPALARVDGARVAARAGRAADLRPR
jgi:aminobenzoyl-glutamate transport protein